MCEISIGLNQRLSHCVCHNKWQVMETLVFQPTGSNFIAPYKPSFSTPFISILCWWCWLKKNTTKLQFPLWNVQLLLTMAIKQHFIRSWSCISTFDSICDDVLSNIAFQHPSKNYKLKIKNMTLSLGALHLLAFKRFQALIKTRASWDSLSFEAR